tara:strand:+ start:54 stop:2024 length:1971 start_codon:yes stop_codon:yes gene_type:complete
MLSPAQAELPYKPAAIIVQQGKVLDFIDGITQRKETPEEYVRQEIAKSLVREYRYAKAHFEIEFGLKLGSRKPRADIAIFPPDEEHVQEEVFLLVECKQQSVKPQDKNDGVGQLQSYMSACPNATYGMWTNGIERICYKKIVTKGKIKIEEIPDIPTFGRKDDESERPRFDQLKPATSDALLFAFRRCHNYIAANQGMQKPQAFWELLKLIFCKIHDERYNDEPQFYSTATERNGAIGLMAVKERMDGLFEKVKGDYGAIFGMGDQLELEPRVLAYLVSQLQMYSLLESDTDVKGKAYEAIVGSNLRGDSGEFFTPRNICEMAVAMLDPGEKDLILDPACGTGGFLITAMNHVVKKIRKAEKKKWKGTQGGYAAAVAQRIANYASKCIVGIDFNQELVKATKMNMVMNNDGAGGLFQANSLVKPVLWRDALRDRPLLGKVRYLFTNPPFGSKIPVTDPAILEQYDLARSWSFDAEKDQWVMSTALQKSQPPEILFIERCLKFLAPGGYAALVLPDGILGSPGLGYVREWILRHSRVVASIDLHPDTFQPDVSIQTSLLILQKKEEHLIAMEGAAERMNDYEVFMAVANHIGHDKRGHRTYVRDANGNEVVEEFEKDVVEYENGIPTYKPQRVREKVVDDNTQQIAQYFRTWLQSQD